MLSMVELFSVHQGVFGTLYTVLSTVQYSDFPTKIHGHLCVCVCVCVCVFAMMPAAVFSQVHSELD